MGSEPSRATPHAPRAPREQCAPCRLRRTEPERSPRGIQTGTQPRLMMPNHPLPALARSLAGATSTPTRTSSTLQRYASPSPRGRCAWTLRENDAVSAMAKQDLHREGLVVGAAHWPHSTGAAPKDLPTLRGPHGSLSRRVFGMTPKTPEEPPEAAEGEPKDRQRGCSGGSEGLPEPSGDGPDTPPRGPRLPLRRGLRRGPVTVGEGTMKVDRVHHPDRPSPGGSTAHRSLRLGQEIPLLPL